MNVYEFHISVVTEKKFNNDDKANVLEAIRSQLGRIKKSGGYLLNSSNLIVSREVTDEDIAEALRENIINNKNEMELD